VDSFWKKLLKKIFWPFCGRIVNEFKKREKSTNILDKK